jgi:hypothetical protein
MIKKPVTCFAFLVGIASAQPVVSNIKADAISHSSLRLTWDNSTPIDLIRVRYGLTTMYDAGLGGGIYVPGTTSFWQFGQSLPLSGLAPSTLYHFCPQSSSDRGATWSACADFAVQTLPLPAVHPAPPTMPASFNLAYPIQTGGTLSVAPDCSNLQSTVNSARYGDTVLIPAGAVCSGTYFLPAAPEAKTFLPTAVNTANAKITLPNHGFSAGQKVRLESSGCLPGSAGPDTFCQLRGLTPGTDYFIQIVDANTFQLLPAVSASPLDFSISTFSASPITGLLTALNGNSLLDGLAIQVKSTGMLPSGLAQNTTYFVLNPSGKAQFKLSTSIGGAPIVFGDSGSGTHSFVDPGTLDHFIMAWPPSDQWIVVRTSTPDDHFCPEGVRCIGSTWAHQMATIKQMTPPAGDRTDIRLLAGILSHNWRFVGIEFTHADNSAATLLTTDPIPYYGFIDMHRSSANIIIDRCYIHGLGAPNRIYRAIVAFDGENMALINSDLEQLDYWHAYANGLVPTISDPTHIQLSAGTYTIGNRAISISGGPVTITISGGSGSGTGIVYFDLAGTLQVVLPQGLSATCSGGNVSCIVGNSTVPTYPYNAGRCCSSCRFEFY